MVVTDVVQLYNGLNAAWKRKDLQPCGQHLQKLKLRFLSGFQFLPTVDAAGADELILARSVLEIGAQYSVLIKDIPSFERYMAQLKSYYFDYSVGLEESAYMYELLGLNLLCLLSQNRVAEFHTELELLPSHIHLSNHYIKHSIEIEQNLMEGSYNKIFLSVGNVPAGSYSYFMNILLGTVRGEIARCIETAYNNISVKGAAEMLFFASADEMRNYSRERGWRVDDANNFVFSSVDGRPHDDVIPSTELAQHMVTYAREMDMIV